ncbi:fructose-2,6-bisphosphatase TIGAR isoform X2 [Hippopotamus amphibius kiboko]|uniref:fructose-2,6-bisphosphatase TIGAR isoform X2 n=2 Tax=Hippopotamus amphibius kiboko TaxID=575201 RepID=UPI0025929CB5|nr:fructose-2,6-bisphosphatase TIGAR isoform X2 [Hippopotamus amphibius kiboko]
MREAGAAFALLGPSAGGMRRFALTVVRHGETRLNKEKILQGQGIDEPLSETGFKQAAAAGVFLNNVTFTHVFSSDLTRAKQVYKLWGLMASSGFHFPSEDFCVHTVHGILEKNKLCKDITVKYDSRLRERKYGVAEGRPLSELRAMAKAAGQECPVFTPPGGETLDQVKMRGKDFFEFLCQLILEEAGQSEQFSQEAPSNCLESSLAEIFPLGKNCASKFNSDSSDPGLVASVLVVSHGAYMRSLLDYFLTDLKCSFPATLSRSELTSVSPNTGMSVFIVNFEKGGEVKPTTQCVCVHLQGHLTGVQDHGPQCIQRHRCLCQYWSRACGQAQRKFTADKKLESN